jgi:hypothetical protein
MDINGMSTKEDLNNIPLGSCDFLIGMDWLDKNHVVLDYYNKAFTCLDEEGKLRTIQGIPRAVIIKEISSLQLNRSFRKGCQIFTMDMEEEPKYKVSSLEEYKVIKEFEYVFGKILGFPPKRDIDFSINLMPGAAPMCKNPYRMSTPKLKELHVKLEEILKKGYIRPSVSPRGSLVLFLKKKDGTLRL